MWSRIDITAHLPRIGCRLLLGCVHALPPTLIPDERVPIRTDDGWALTLRHYAGDGPPVLLVHGMGANHYNWDFRPEVSLADALRADGWDVWVTDLRGDDGTAGPTRRAKREVDFDDYALHDLPAAVHQVLRETGEPRLYWVGHSLGGMLRYAWLAQEPETVAAGVAICSPGQFEDYQPSKLVGTRGWMLKGDGRVPARAYARATRPLGPYNPLWGRIARFDNLDRGEAYGLARVALTDLPTPLARQALDWTRSGALTRLDGTPWLAPAPVPLLIRGAGDDRVVAEADVAATCARFPDCTYHRLDDYGHVDVVLGTRAPDEVWPLVTGFLDQRKQGPTLTAGD
jgi:pimeloyl-ACP methyl ester carboxylesterase